MNRARIVIDGSSLSCDDAKYVAQEATTVTVAPVGVARGRAAWEVAREAALAATDLERLLAASRAAPPRAVR